MTVAEKNISPEITRPTKKLEDEIDRPLKRAIALLNLLGLKTRWCCCGFDYRDQPAHKSHTYDQLQIFISDGPGVKEFLIDFLNSMHQNDGWYAGLYRQAGQDTGWALYTFFGCSNLGAPADWNKRTSEHYHEVPNIKIKALEDYLLTKADQMMDQAVVGDSNGLMATIYENWNVLPGEPWVIKKTDWL